MADLAMGAVAPPAAAPPADAPPAAADDNAPPLPTTAEGAETAAAASVPAAAGGDGDAALAPAPPSGRLGKKRKVALFLGYVGAGYFVRSR